MDNSKYIERLEKRGIKPTANRILVLEAMLAASRAVSLAELEGMLGTVDRSSIFRTLGHFLKNRLIHDIEDGSGSVKYEVCDSDSACSVADMHAHFFCEVCHRTYCLKKVQIPVTTLPEGFVMHSVNYTVKGICERCSKAR
jgi:Fur family ferric uptake transcriptional regulator